MTESATNLEERNRRQNRLYESQMAFCTLDILAEAIAEVKEAEAKEAEADEKQKQEGNNPNATEPTPRPRTILA